MQGAADQIGIVELDRRLAQPAAGSHGDLPGAAHPKRGRGQGVLDLALFLGRDLGLLCRGFFRQLHPYQGIGRANPAGHGLGHDQFQNFQVEQRRVPARGFATGRPAPAHAPFEELRGMLPADLARIGDTPVLEEQGHVPPAQGIHGESRGGGCPVCEESADPFPASGGHRRGSDRDGLGVSAFGGEELGAFRVPGRVMAEPGILRAPDAGNFRAQVPVGGVLPLVERGHDAP